MQHQHFTHRQKFGRRVGTPRNQPKDVVSLLVTRPARHVGLVVFRVNILARPGGPSAKPSKFMTIETRSVTKKSTMGKLLATHSSQNPGAEGPLRAQPTVAVTPEASKGTRQGKRGKRWRVASGHRDPHKDNKRSRDRRHNGRL